MQNKLIKNIIKTGAIISLSSPLIGLISCGKLQDWQKADLIDKYIEDNFSIEAFKTFIHDYKYSSPFMTGNGNDYWSYLMMNNPREKKMFDKQWSSFGFNDSHLKKIENIIGNKIYEAAIDIIWSKKEEVIDIQITFGAHPNFGSISNLHIEKNELLSEEEEWNKLWFGENWLSRASELNSQKVYYSKWTGDLDPSYNKTYENLKEVSGGAIREFTDEYKNMALKSIWANILHPSASHFKVLFAGGDQTHYEYELYLYYENPVKDSIYDYIHLDEPIKVRIAKS